MFHAVFTQGAKTMEAINAVIEVVEVNEVETCAVCNRDFPAGTCSWYPTRNGHVLVHPECDLD
jgi:hypothetical protein